MSVVSKTGTWTLPWLSSIPTSVHPNIKLSAPPFDQPLRDRDIGRLAPLRGNVQAQLFIYDAMGLGTVRVIWQNGV